VQGHIVDQTGQGIGGLTVWVGSSGGGVQTVPSDPDGLFTAVLFPQSHSANTHCPIFPSFSARTFSVWLTNQSGFQASDVRTFQYYNCGIAGEFHFDFVKVN
jgi:hypothetical protein